MQALSVPQLRPASCSQYSAADPQKINTTPSPGFSSLGLFQCLQHAITDAAWEVFFGSRPRARSFGRIFAAAFGARARHVRIAGAILAELSLRPTSGLTRRLRLISGNCMLLREPHKSLSRRVRQQGALLQSTLLMAAPAGTICSSASAGKAGRSALASGVKPAVDCRQGRVRERAEAAKNRSLVYKHPNACETAPLVRLLLQALPF